MRAAVIDGYGQGMQPRIADLPVPSPGPGEVLVKISAAAVNPIDWKVADGYFRLFSGHRFPLVLGSDLSGTVEALGSGVTGLREGDAVFGMAGGGTGHTFAEYAVVKARLLAPKPAALTHPQAAALPLVGTTVLSGLRGAAQPAPGKRVYLRGGSGGVGVFAVQYCKHLGAEVIASCSGANAELVTSLGADRVIDYRTSDPLAQLQEVDLVFDTIGDLDPVPYWQVMRAGGMIVSTGNGPCTMEQLARRLGGAWLLAAQAQVVRYNLRGKLRAGVGYRFIIATPSGDKMARIAALAQEGAVKAVIAREYPLQEAAAAISESRTGRVAGKLVLIP